ncbi:Transmembrane protein adipocyte-associated 1-like protein [Bienertia sinuspersici]
MSLFSVTPALEVPISSESNSSATIADSVSVKANDHRAYSWLLECHGFIHNFFLILLSALFILYLVFQAKKSYRKLWVGRSHIINSYYGIVWLVSLLNFTWCCLQIQGGKDQIGAFGNSGIWECTPGKMLSWNLLSLFTTSGLLFLEVSLIAFLLQGSYTSGTEALTRTFAISACFVGLDVLLKYIDIVVENYSTRDSSLHFAGAHNGSST